MKKAPERIEIPRRGDRYPSAIETARTLERGSKEFERAAKAIEEWAESEDQQKKKYALAAALLLYARFGEDNNNKERANAHRGGPTTPTDPARREETRPTRKNGLDHSLDTPAKQNHTG